MLRRTRRSTRTDTLFPSTTLFRSRQAAEAPAGRNRRQLQPGVGGQLVAPPEGEDHAAELIERNLALDAAIAPPAEPLLVEAAGAGEGAEAARHQPEALFHRTRSVPRSGSRSLEPGAGRNHLPIPSPAHFPQPPHLTSFAR